MITKLINELDFIDDKKISNISTPSPEFGKNNSIEMNNISISDRILYNNDNNSNQK